MREVKTWFLNETYLYGPMDYAKTLKLQFRVGDLNLPERRRRYTRSREEEEEYAQMCHVLVAEQKRIELTLCENVKCTRRNGMCWRRRGKQTTVIWRNLQHHIMCTEKTIAIPGDRWWQQKAKQEGHKVSVKILCSIWKRRDEHLNVGHISIRSRNGAPSRKGCVVNGQLTKASNKCVPPYARK